MGLIRMLAGAAVVAAAVAVIDRPGDGPSPARPDAVKPGVADAGTMARSALALCQHQPDICRAAARESLDRMTADPPKGPYPSGRSPRP